MPDPVANTNPGYTWLYRFLHAIAGNLTTAFEGKIPSLRALVFILIVPLLLAMPACAMRYKAHPRALNQVDSAAYDTSLIADTSIDLARPDFKSELLTDAAEP